MWRGACVVGSEWWGAGTARHAGQTARAVRSAGCHGMRKVWRGEAARTGADKEGGDVERGAWAVGDEAGAEASGQAGEACRWRAAPGLAQGGCMWS